MEISYLERAPDHGAPELAVILQEGRRSRVVVLAVGEAATHLRQAPKETLMELAYAEIAKMVSD